MHKREKKITIQIYDLFHIVMRERKKKKINGNI